GESRRIQRPQPLACTELHHSPAHLWPESGAVACRARTWHHAVAAAKCPDLIHPRVSAGRDAGHRPGCGHLRGRPAIAAGCTRMTHSIPRDFGEISLTIA